MSLFQLERERDVDELIALLRESDVPEVRQHAAEILGRLADDEEWDVDSEPIGALITAAQSDDDGDVRATAVDALDQRGIDAIQQLLVDLTGDLDPSDLEGAQWVSANAFRDVLDADLPELRMAAVTGLGRIGDGDAIKPVVECLDDPDSRVRVRAARSCGRIGDPRAVGALADRLDDPSIEVRRAVANALGQIGTEQAIAALRGLLDDESESVRRIAVDGLGKSSDPRAADALIEALHDDSDSVSRAAVLSLVELLSNAPPRRSHEMREVAVDTLETAEADRVVPPLVDLADSDLTAQRRNAIWLLGRVADGRRTAVIERLVEALDDDDQTTAQFAATSLVELNAEASEELLLGLLTDEGATTATRAKAAFVLGTVGGDDARQELSRLVETVESDDLRKQILSALSKLGGTNVGATTVEKS